MMQPAIKHLGAVLIACGSIWLAARAADGFGLNPPDVSSSLSVPGNEARNGLDVYRQFRERLATPACPPSHSVRWSGHFKAVPKRLAAADDDTLALFGYVLDEVHAAGLPSEYALIPFVESGYRPAARSPLGPTGMWQMIASTARHHEVPVGKHYDGRLSPVESTRAAVRYLKTLHGMFAGDWRLAAMAYNTGEYRVFAALRKAGQTPAAARPERLDVPSIARAYVRKIQAISCVIEHAESDPAWQAALDRPLPRLHAVAVPEHVADLRSWAEETGQSHAWLKRWNPALAQGRIARVGGKRPLVLAALSTGTDLLGTPSTVPDPGIASPEGAAVLSDVRDADGPPAVPGGSATAATASSPDAPAASPALPPSTNAEDATARLAAAVAASLATPPADPDFPAPPVAGGGLGTPATPASKRPASADAPI